MWRRRRDVAIDCVFTAGLVSLGGGCALQWGPGAAGVAVGIVLISTAGVAALRGARDAFDDVSELGESQDAVNR